MQGNPSLPPVWRSYGEAALALGARLTGEALVPGRSAGRLDALARRLHRELDQMMQKAWESLSGGGEFACAPGCDVCCRTLPITASPVEIFTLLHRLGDMAGADAGLAARLAGAAPPAGHGSLPPAPLADPASAPPAVPGSSRAPGALPPCPLLGENGLCLVYSSRPLACRGCVSGDAAACRACDENRPVPRSTAYQLGAAAMMKGVCEALDALGLVSRPVDIRAGLALALGAEDVERRWLRGEDVFQGALLRYPSSS